MYTIRLELGRELEDLLFCRMQAKRDAEERAYEKYRAKRAWYLRRIGQLSLHLGFLIGILIFVFADISKVNELRDLREELDRRPFIYEAHPLIDKTVVEEARKKAEEIEKLKTTQYYAEETDKTEGMGEEVISKYGIVVDIKTIRYLQAVTDIPGYIPHR